MILDGIKSLLELANRSFYASAAVFAAYVLLMLWLAESKNVIIRMCLPGLIVIVFGPTFLVGNSFSSGDYTELSKSQALLAIFNVFSAIAGIIVAFALIYRETGLKQQNGDVRDIPNCIYFSIVTFTTLGYGDITPIGKSKIVVGAEVLIGYLVLALLANVFPGLANRLRDAAW